MLRIGLACGLGLATPAVAKELKWTHYGLRPLAMGNAYVAVADDYNALFYNPAGLARLKDWDGEFLNPSVEISRNTVDFAKEMSDLVSKGEEDVTPVLDLLERNTGKTHHFSVGLTPHLVFPGWGFGVGAEFGTTLAVHREISTDIDSGLRVVAPFSMATNLLEDRLSVGASIKFVAKGGIDREFSINDIEAFVKNKDDSTTTDSTTTAADDDKAELKDYIEGGTGVGFDAGMLFTPVKTMEPTLGISITDLGGTPYKKFDVGGESLGTPKLRLPSVNTGVSAKPWAANNMYVRTAIDAHAINQPEHYSKKFNLGVEWGYSDFFKVQTGLHQGELSGGFEFDVFLFTLRFATYAEQLGTRAGQDDDLRDRRYALQMKLLI
jgi:hypothetical protein